MAYKRYLLTPLGAALAVVAAEHVYTLVLQPYILQHMVQYCILLHASHPHTTANYTATHLFLSFTAALALYK